MNQRSAGSRSGFALLPPDPHLGVTDSLVMAMLAGIALASRVPFLNGFVNQGKDGWAYVEALRLSPPYRVPAPGNIGFVLLGVFAEGWVRDPVLAFALVNIGLTAAGILGFYLLARR